MATDKEMQDKYKRLWESFQERFRTRANPNTYKQKAVSFDDIKLKGEVVEMSSCSICGVVFPESEIEGWTCSECFKRGTATGLKYPVIFDI